MRVLLLGGYGVFGARLAELLVRDGHDVCIAGRSLAKARACAAPLGCRAAALDRAAPDAALAAALAGEDAVVDAAGPFQAYGADPYRLARAAMAAGVHYLDLCDDAAFCAGIGALDGQARAAGVCVVSGLSSVPALSSAAVRALAGEDPPLVIDGAILPGNRAPRGLSVMQSILSQAGRPMPLWRGGRWETAPGWSAPAEYALPGGLTRQGWMIGVPDQRLFPAHFGAGAVIFRAGLELGVMRYGLFAFALLRRALPIPVGPPLVRAFKLAADALAPFGTGRGGMAVQVTTAGEVRAWRLLAEDGDGPYIPAVPARALLRRAAPPPGARPALEAITLEEAEAAMADLRVRTERSAAPRAPLFPRALGADFAALPEAVQATHRTADTARWTGRCRVERGRGAWPRLLCALFGFPAAAGDVAVEVSKRADPGGETWERRFGARRFRSRLSLAPDGLRERFGPFSFTIGLRVQDGALHFPVTAGRLGPLRLPRALLPGSEAREYAADGAFHFDVALRAPITGGLMVRYAGRLAPAAPGDPAAPPG
ncbi:DUF4166 domain-containing protein [Rhodovulum sp. DZ06]|uniref:SDR family oxidoreductase n=1 Tax=Rhodovulum sp. DZ06 TaxID=3425126 RepID=UPI003D34CF60